MAKYIEGDHNAKGLRFGIVVSRFNDFVTSKLLDGALSAFKEHGADEEDLEVVRVPGAFEIPQAAKKLCSSREFDAIICLGAVIKGDTPHFDFISKATIDGIMKLSIEHKKPIGNGIITCLNRKQAFARRKKGQEAAAALLSVLNTGKVLAK